MRGPILFGVFLGMCAAQTTVNGGRDYKGTLSVSGTVSAVDFSGAGATAPVKTGVLGARPAACSRGQIYFATDVTAGQNLYFCTVTGSPGTWSQMTGAAGSTAATGSGSPSGSCAPPAMYIDTTNQELWFCGATNSWKKPAADMSNVPTLGGANAWTGYNNLSAGQWRPPESTVASLPPASANVGKVFMVTDAASAGNCSVGGGSIREQCRANGSNYECVGGCGAGGSGSAPYQSALVAGPDTVKTIPGAAHGFQTTALLVAVYDNGTPRNAITAGWTVNAATFDVTITFAAPQSNYYVVINGGTGPQGPQGPQGPAADLSNVPTLSGTSTWTGYSNFAAAQWRPPESTVANLPSAAANTGKVFLVTDAAAGSCTAGGGSVREFCRATASSYECVGGCGGSGGGGGSSAYISPLITGPDTVKTISAATHGFPTTALLVGVYDSSTPRNAISASWAVNPANYDVVISFVSPQSNYYVVINGGIGPQGPQGPAGPQGPTGGGSTGTVNRGTAGQVAVYTGAGTVVGGIGPGTAAQVLHGNASGQPAYGPVTTADIAANAIGSAQQAVVNTRRTCAIVVGADNGNALAASDIAPQGRQCFVPAAAHVVEITVAADAGTPAVVVAKNHGGTVTDLSASMATASGGGLACANAAGSGTSLDGATTCAVQLTTTALAAGDWIETHSSASASTAKRMSISITYTVD